MFEEDNLLKSYSSLPDNLLTLSNDFSSTKGTSDECSGKSPCKVDTCSSDSCTSYSGCPSDTSCPTKTCSSYCADTPTYYTATYYCYDTDGIFLETSSISIASGAQFTPSSWVPTITNYTYQYISPNPGQHTVTGNESYNVFYAHVACTYNCYDEESNELIAIRKVNITVGAQFTPSAHVPTIDGYSYHYISSDPGQHTVVGDEQYTVYYTPSSSVWIYNGTTWVKAIPWIYNGSEWKRATAWIYNGSNWKQC